MGRVLPHQLQFLLDQAPSILHHELWMVIKNRKHLLWRDTMIVLKESQQSFKI